MEKKKQEKSKAKKIANIVSGVVSYSLAIGLCIGIVNKNVQVRSKFDSVDKNCFYKTIFGTPIYLPIENGEVSLNIQDVFTPEEKEQLVFGINQLDDVAQGFDYNITFEDADIKKSINIKGWDSSLDEQNHSGLAATITPVNNFTAEIYYPITINFNLDNLRKKDRDLSVVIQHELMHTLGFKDLYDYEDSQRMMYGIYSDEHKFHEDEINMLNTIYSPARTGYTVEKPKQVKYVNASFDYKFNDEDTLEC